ncbi:HupE/UreJ family protein [Methylomonas sp. AM2-LC]|uniref:HupE/UreJ family protein n=1 Tax=Methylomonas sp. AM2-LC TaxID=3153301 RepID=UPI0032647618
MNFYIKGLLALLLTVFSASAFAHAPGLSSMDVRLNTDNTLVKVTFALQDIEAFAPMDSDLDAEVSDAERDAAKPSIAKLLAEQLHISIDGSQYVPIAPGKVEFDQQNNAHVTFTYQATPKQQLTIDSRFLSQLPEGHQQYLTLRDDSGKTLVEKMLLKQDAQLNYSVIAEGRAQQTAAQYTWLGSFSDFFKLGVEHILTGYDHLLFLFALLAVTHSFWPALKIITFFTIAHSITLACAGLSLIELPSSFVEPVIALTIIYVSLENVFRGDHPKGRQWLTFGFGLIHGFGFASVLREMGISSGESGILVPLLSFNLGIETGQLTVAAIVLPIIWWINNNMKIAEKLLKGCSLSVCLMGTYWLLERTVFL